MNVFTTLKTLKTLLIEDDIWIRDSLAMLFESEACSLTALETAEEGLQAIQNNAYDLIIVDYKLPGLNGLEFLKRVPAGKSKPTTMLITAYLTKALVSDARKLEVQQVLEKPFSSEIFIASLASILQNMGRLSAGAQTRNNGSC